MTNTSEIVRGKSDTAFRLGQETIQRPFRIYQNFLSVENLFNFTDGTGPETCAWKYRRRVVLMYSMS